MGPRPRGAAGNRFGAEAASKTHRRRRSGGGVQPTGNDGGGVVRWSWRLTCGSGRSGAMVWSSLMLRRSSFMARDAGRR
jgi:hypothetical protein